MEPATDSSEVQPSIPDDAGVSDSTLPPSSQANESVVPSFSLARQYPPLPTIPSSSTIDLNNPNTKHAEKSTIGKERRNKGTRRKRRRPKYQNDSNFTRHNVSQVAIIEDGEKINEKKNIQGEEEDEPSPGKKVYLPLNQYECILKRRAIRKSNAESKLDEIKKKIGTNSTSPKYSILPHDESSEMENLEKHGISLTPRESLDGNGHEDVEDVMEVVGDTSLGMKLTILSGKVIVQAVTPLSDGRASPAQLSGKVSKGDVLLSIDGRSLVYGVSEDFNLDLLVERLKPLSKPDEDGFFSRFVKVRFAVGEGLELMSKDALKGEHLKKKLQLDTKLIRDRPVEEVGNALRIASYMTVDHFSGAQLWQQESSPYIQKNRKMCGKVNAITSEPPKIDNQLLIPFSSKNYVPLCFAISLQVAWEQTSNKRRYISAFFVLNDEVSDLLREQSGEKKERAKEISLCSSESNAQKELLELGKLALSSAKCLYDEVASGSLHNMDPLEVVRSECRSFSSRSRFSHKYVPQNNDSDDEASEGDNSILNESDLDEIGDEVLFKLAVWNRTWKRRMVETLEAKSIHTKEREKKIERRNIKTDTHNDFLQNLLFGTQVTDLMNNKSTVALPPPEITEVLFDLANRVTTRVPHDVRVTNELDASYHDETVQNEAPSSRIDHSQSNDEVAEATRFLLDEILPAWIDTFKPICVGQRQVLWPAMKEHSNSNSNSDDLSMESAASGWSVGTPERRAKLAEKVAHMELDPHTRIETCHLVTFYFTQKILPGILVLDMKREKQMRGAICVKEIEREAEDSAIAFVEKYGSYLKLFESLVAASDFFSWRIIQSLLSLARHDPSHNEAMKLLGRNIFMIPYESKMLPCILVRLGKCVCDKNATETRKLLPLLVAAFPDIKPWEIRSTLPSFFMNTTSPGAIMDDELLAALDHFEIDMYFDYLSLLMDISLLARTDASLVREWCIISVSEKFNELHRENFFKVALPQSQSTKTNFHRDLSFLIDTSVRINDEYLTLELADEIIFKKRTTCNELLVKTVGYLRLMSLNRDTDNGKTFNEAITRQVLILFDKISKSPHQMCKNLIQLSDELAHLLNTISKFGNGEEEIITLMTNTVSPHELLEAFSRWTSHEVSMASIVNALRSCLISAIENGINDEISSSLLRVRKIRRKGTKSGLVLDSMRNGEISHLSDTRHQNKVWGTMANGIAIIDK